MNHIGRFHSLWTVSFRGGCILMWKTSIILIQNVVRTINSTCTNALLFSSSKQMWQFLTLEVNLLTDSYKCIIFVKFWCLLISFGNQSLSLNKTHANLWTKPEPISTSLIHSLHSAHRQLLYNITCNYFYHIKIVIHAILHNAKNIYTYR